MRLWSLCMFLGAVPTLTFAEPTELIHWNAGDDRSSKLIAEVLSRSADKLATVKVIDRSMGLGDETLVCSARILRPGLSEGPYQSEDNFLRCDRKSANGRRAALELDLSSEAIHRWGTSTYPRGASIRGTTAEIFYSVLEQMYAEDRSDRYLLRREYDFASLDANYSFIEYQITMSENSLSANVSTRRSLVCSKDFYYHGSVRPAVADTFQCDFVYLFGPQ